LQILFHTSKLYEVCNLKILMMFGVLLFAIPFVNPTFGHGFGSETLPPLTVGDRNATISITVNPPIFDPNNKETNILMRFYNADTDAVIEHVSYLIGLYKDNKIVFRYMFHDDLGNLFLKVISNDSDKIVIHGKKEPLLGGWMKADDLNPVTLEGPVFNSGGLYKFEIEILTVDSDDKILDERPVYDGAISVAEKTTHEITTNEGNKHLLSLTSYYDQISNFQYVPDSKSIKFSMPFGWSETNINQVLVVHEEIHIPKSLGEILVTKYTGYVNGLLLSDKAITIDDYSTDDRIVHVVLNTQDLLDLAKIRENSKQDMEFTIQPSGESNTSISVYTRNAQYKVDLGWDPPTILAGSTTKFFFDVKDPYLITNKTLFVSYDFTIVQNNEEIFRISGTTHNEKNVIDVTLPTDVSGPIRIKLDNLGGNSLADAEFLSTVNPIDKSQTFPIKLSSYLIQDGRKIPGKYNVDLTWIPSPIKIAEQTEFIITIYDRETGLPVQQAEYDFVLLQNNLEIQRKVGLAQAGGSFEEYFFSGNNLGTITLRIENIDESREFVEIPISVTPEFPFGSLIVLLFVFVMIITLSKLRFLSHAY